MQISRCVVLACAATTLVTTHAFVASAQQDSDAQQRARRALDQKIQDMQTQPAQAAPAPAPVAPQPKPAPAPAPAAQPKAAPAAQPKAAHPTQTTQAAPAPAPKPKPAPVATSSEAQYLPIPDTANPQSDEKIREALRRKELEMGQPTPVIVEMAKPAPTSTTVAPANAEAYRTTEKVAAKPKEASKPKETPKAKMAAVPALEPLPAPPSGLSASKEQRLGELLQQYRMDQITPEEYHKQRAKIMAGP